MSSQMTARACVLRPLGVRSTTSIIRSGALRAGGVSRLAMTGERAASTDWNCPSRPRTSSGVAMDVVSSVLTRTTYDDLALMASCEWISVDVERGATR